jgi:hypothetical protein
LQDRKVVVINKYFETEARINSLIEILPTLDIRMDELSEVSRKFIEKINQQEISFEK